MKNILTFPDKSRARNLKRFLVVLFGVVALLSLAFVEFSLELKSSGKAGLIIWEEFPKKDLGGPSKAAERSISRIKRLYGVWDAFPMDNYRYICVHFYLERRGTCIMTSPDLITQ